MRSKRGLAYQGIIAHNTSGGGSHERARLRSSRKGEEMKRPRNRILGEPETPESSSGSGCGKFDDKDGGRKDG